MTDKNFLSFDNDIDRDFENEDWITVARSENESINSNLEFILVQNSNLSFRQ